MTTPNHRRSILKGIVASLAIAGAALATSMPAAAQDTYEPGKLTIIVPFNPGGSVDRMSRAIAQYLPEELGVPVTVVNRPGGGGTLGHTYFLQQPDDGSAALVTPANPYLISNVLRSNGALDWDAFHFINGQWEDYYVILVNNDQPFQTGAELIQFIIDNPGEASSAIINGDGGHLATLIMLERLGLEPDAVTFVSYDGGAPMRTALAGNQVTFSMISALGSSVIADDVRPLAVLRAVPDEKWDAPNINEILAAWDVEIPLLAGDLRTLAVQQSFVDKHPEVYAKLVAAYRSMLGRHDFKTFIAEGQIGGDWMGPEATAESMNISYEVFEKYIDALN
jgi:putative tricarboxylic transport membrane protein